MAKIKEGYMLVLICPPGYPESRVILLEDLDLDEPEGQSLLAHTITEWLPKEAFEEENEK